MPVMIQLRHVHEPLHRKLKSRAALEGKSLSDYLLKQIQAIASRPTIEELKARLEERSAITPRLTPAKAVRAERDRR